MQVQLGGQRANRSPLCTIVWILITLASFASQAIGTSVDTYTGISSESDPHFDASDSGRNSVSFHKGMEAGTLDFAIPNRRLLTGTKRSRKDRRSDGRRVLSFHGISKPPIPRPPIQNSGIHPPPHPV
ncbi:hypothetical protein R1sor_025883 [Riccia sorocarpa]|uniref:Uncharacterized protein n=1 Tax=Riccia sorocarpa TaxID=122646 RepID=A0ABD3GCX0_9MARC